MSRSSEPSGLVMVLAAVGAFFARSYRRLSQQYLGQEESVPAEPAAA